VRRAGTSAHEATAPSPKGMQAAGGLNNISLTLRYQTRQYGIEGPGPAVLAFRYFRLIAASDWVETLMLRLYCSFSSLNCYFGSAPPPTPTA
jgi:hypothetical protein